MATLWANRVAYRLPAAPLPLLRPGYRLP